MLIPTKLRKKRESTADEEEDPFLMNCIDSENIEKEKNTTIYGGLHPDLSNFVDLSKKSNTRFIETACRKPRFKPMKPKKSQNAEKPRIEVELKAGKNPHAILFRTQTRRQNQIFSRGTELRFFFHQPNSKAKVSDYKYFGGEMPLEYARAEQERLLRGAAARVRSQANFRVLIDTKARNSDWSEAFSFVVQDVHSKYPNHWKYSNFFSRLGLPRNAQKREIKSAYRRLCLFYHPDRNIGKDIDNKQKFQAVTEAYNAVMKNS